MRDEPALEITPELLLHAYANGIFPMAENAEDQDIFWIDPKRRGVLPLDGLHISRSLRRDFLRRDFVVKVDTAFAEVLEACADRPETWINEAISDLYGDLHRMGHAHSVEIHQDGELVGGLYGVAIGGAFFGESMFSHMRDASKFALVALVARLRFGGFTLLDTQFVTDHLKRLGCIEIARDAYHKRLLAALCRPAAFDKLPRDASRQLLVQLTTQTS